MSLPFRALSPCSAAQACDHVTDQVGAFVRFDLVGVVGQHIRLSDVPSIVELPERFAALEEAVAERDVLIAVLKAENAELRRRLGQLAFPR